jgi:hypothetical protein
MRLWALVGVPAMLLALSLIGYVQHWAQGQAEIPWHQQNYQHVIDAYRQVRYLPPQGRYSEQILRVCARTGSGESPNAARGLLAGATRDQEA